MEVAVEIEQGLELDGPLLFFNIREDALENVRPVVGTHVDADAHVLYVGKQTVAFYETHFDAGLVSF